MAVLPMFDPAVVVKAIERIRPTTTFMAAVHLQRLLFDVKSSAYDFSSFRLVAHADSVGRASGVNVYPAEVEQALLELDGVDQAVVFGSPDERWGNGYAQSSRVQCRHWRSTHSFDPGKPAASPLQASERYRCQAAVAANRQRQSRPDRCPADENLTPLVSCDYPPTAVAAHPDGTLER